MQSYDHLFRKKEQTLCSNFKEKHKLELPSTSCKIYLCINEKWTPKFFTIKRLSLLNMPLKDLVLLNLEFAFAYICSAYPILKQLQLFL